MMRARGLKLRGVMALGVVVCGVLFAAVPALAAAPEAPLLEAATYRTPTEAGLRGELNPVNPGETGTYEFLYRKSATECESGSHTVPVTALGNQEEFVEGALTGLEPGGTYTVCLLAANEALPPEKTPSAPVMFTLPEETPATREVKEVTGTTATLHGELNPLRSGTAGYEFTYNHEGLPCEPGVTGTTTTLEAEQTGKGIQVSTKVTGLAPNTEYTFCPVAVNKPGELAVASPSQTFKTGPAAAPKVDSESAAGVGSTGATLEAQVNPDGQTTSYSFEYSTKGKTGAGETLEAPIVMVAGKGTLPAVYEDQTASVPTGTLLAGTTYYYRVVAGNATPPASDGTVQSFTTVPVPHTEPVSAITATTATFNGTLTPFIEPTEYFFYYDRGTEPVCINEQATGPEPASTGSVFTDVTGLEPSQKYTVCVVSVNAFGSVEDSASPPVHFTTLAAAPVVENPNASGLTPTEATLEAVVNPNNEKTTCEFQYGKTTSYGTDKPCSSPTLEGFGGQGVSLPVSGLTPGRTYHYRVLAKSAAGGPIEVTGEFTTLALEAPGIEFEGDSSVTPNEVQLEAVVNPEYQETSCQFEYSAVKATIEAGTGTKKACNPPQLGNGFGGVYATAIVTGLTPKTKYYYRVVAKNGTGTTTDMTIEEFETGTLKMPVIESEGVSNITQTTATLEAQVNPEYQKTPYEFEYAAKEESLLFEGKGTKVAGGELPAGSILTGFGEHSASAKATGLIPNTLYYYRVVAKNPTGQAEQIPTVQSFTTSSIPTVSTGGHSGVTATTATLSGTVDPDGLPTTYYFQYGGTTSYGKQSVTIGAGEGTSPVAVSAPLSGLEPGVTYHYRIVATNDNGGTTQTTYGEDETFTTPATPPILTGLTVSSVTQSSATITVTLDPQNLSTRYELEVGATPGALQPQAAGNTNSTTQLTLPVGSLSPGTVYYYKLIATSTDGVGESTGQFVTAPGPATAAPPAAPALIPYQSIAELDAKEAKEAKGIPTPIITKTLTKAEKLKKALKACHGKKGKKRSRCEAAAHKKYGSSKKKKA